MASEMLADIVAEMRTFGDRRLNETLLIKAECVGLIVHIFANLLDAAWKRERDELVYSFDPTMAGRSRAPAPSAYAIEGMKGFETEKGDQK